MHNRRLRLSGLRSHLISLLLCGVLFTPAERAWAADEDDSGDQLNEIIVTARKREERVQDVPISMTVLAGDRLSISPIAANADIARAVPNATFVDAGGQSTNFSNVRGVGSFSPVASDDTSVVYYVGEIPQSVYGISPNLVDVERVEVLRGPQGTLFGRNTQAGAISVVPAKPAFDDSLWANGEVGSHGYGLAQAIGNATLVPDRLAARLAMSYATYNGDIPNIAAGGKDGSLGVGTVRGSLLFKSDAATEALLMVTYGGEHTHSPRFLLRDALSFPISETIPRTDVDGDTIGANLRVDHRFDGLTLTSLSSFQRNHSTQLLDLTDGLVFAKVIGLPASFFDVPGADLAYVDFREQQYLQEIRLASQEGAKIAWALGVNYYRTELDSDRDARALTPAFLTSNGIQNNRFTTDSYAVFGEVTIPLIERLDLTVGLRGTHERKQASYRFSSNGLPGVVPSSSQDASFSDEFVSGRAILSYRWSPQVMTYALVARGYVSAGYPAISVNGPLGKPDAIFPASTSWTYEAGFKTELLSKRLILNGSAFYNDVRNGHLAAFLPAQGLFTMAALDYESYGGEIELIASPVAGLELSGGLGYTHARLKDISPGNPTGARSGNEVPNAPNFTANISMAYRRSVQQLGLPGALSARVSYHHVGGRAADVLNSFALAAYDLVNGKLGWDNSGISIYVFANNLFDQRYESWGQSFGPVPTVRTGQGRVIGAGASLSF